MWTRLAAVMAGMFLGASANAEPTDFIGKFSGTETRSTEDCGSHNGTKTFEWSVTHRDLDGNAFEGSGSTATGDFTVTGEVSDSQASGRIEGVSNAGHRWSGTFEGRIDADTYTVTSAGQVDRSRCKFTSRIEAVRQ